MKTTQCLSVALTHSVFSFAPGLQAVVREKAESIKSQMRANKKNFTEGDCKELDRCVTALFACAAAPTPPECDLMSSGEL